MTSRGEEVQRLVDGTASDLQKSELVTVCTHPGFAIAIPFVDKRPQKTLSHPRFQAETFEYLRARP